MRIFIHILDQGDSFFSLSHLKCVTVWIDCVLSCSLPLSLPLSLSPSLLPSLSLSLPPSLHPSPLPLEDKKADRMKEENLFHRRLSLCPTPTSPPKIDTRALTRNLSYGGDSDLYPLSPDTLLGPPVLYPTR